jgi:hypothetical protein
MAIILNAYWAMSKEIQDDLNMINMVIGMSNDI